MSRKATPASTYAMSLSVPVPSTMRRRDNRVQFSDNTEIDLDAVPSQHPDTIESEDDPDDDSHYQGYTLG